MPARQAVTVRTLGPACRRSGCSAGLGCVDLALELTVELIKERLSAVIVRSLLI